MKEKAENMAANVYNIEWAKMKRTTLESTKLISNMAKTAASIDEMK